MPTRRKLTKKKLQVLAFIQANPGVKNANQISTNTGLYYVIISRALLDLLALELICLEQGLFITDKGELLLKKEREKVENKIHSYFQSL